MVEVTSGELVTRREATCSEQTLPPRWESQTVSEYKHVYKRRRHLVESSSAENWRRNGGELIKSPGHESFSASPQEILQPDEVLLQGSKGREGSQQTKSTSPSAAPPVPRKICQRPALPRKAKKGESAEIPKFKIKRRQSRSLQKISAPECSPEFTRPALSDRGVTRKVPIPIALTRSLRLRKEKKQYSDNDSGKDFGEEIPSARTRSRRLRKENRRYSENDFDEDFESKYKERGEGSSQNHDYHPQGRWVRGGVQVISAQRTSETANSVKSWSGHQRRSSNAKKARKIFLSMSSPPMHRPSMGVSLGTEGMAGIVNNVGQTHESAKSGDMVCKSSEELQNYDNMALGTLSPVIPLAFVNPHPMMEDHPSRDNSPQGPQTPEKLQKRKRVPSREELLPTQESTPEQDVSSSSGNTTPPTVRLLTTVTTEDAIVRRSLLPLSGPLSCGIFPEVCMNPSRELDRVPEPTYQAHTVDLPGSLPCGSLSQDSPKALSIFIDLSPYFLGSQKEVTTLNTQAVVSRALAEAPLLASESRGLLPASLTSGVSSGHHLEFPTLIAGSSQKDVETCATDADSLPNNVHAFPMQHSPPSNGHSQQNLQEKVMKHAQEMHPVKVKVRKKKFTPKVKKAMKPKVPKVPKEKNMLKRNSRTSRDNGYGVLRGGFNCGDSDELNATNNHNQDPMLKKARMEKPSSPEPEGQNAFPSFTELEPHNSSRPANRAPSPCPTMVIDMKRIMRKPRSGRKQRRANKIKVMTYVDEDLGGDPNDVADNSIENPPLTKKALLSEMLGDGIAQPADVILLSRDLDHEISSGGSEPNLMLRKAVVDQLTPEYSASLIDGSKMEGLQVVRDTEVCEAFPVQSSDPVIEDLNGAPSTSDGTLKSTRQQTAHSEHTKEVCEAVPAHVSLASKETSSCTPMLESPHKPAEQDNSLQALCEGRPVHIFRPFVNYPDQKVPSSTFPFMSFVNYQNMLSSTPRSPPNVVQEQIPLRDVCVQAPRPVVEDVPTTPKGNFSTIELMMEESPNPESPLSPISGGIRCVQNTEETSSQDCGSRVLCIKKNVVTGMYQCKPKPVRRSLLPQFDSVGQTPEVSLVPSLQVPPKKSRPWKGRRRHRILDQPTPFTRMSRSQKEAYMRHLSDEYKYSPLALVSSMSRKLTDTQLSEVKSLLFNQNAPSEQDLQIVAYKGAVKEIVLYQAPLLWRRKVKFKPKVGLDSETITMFRRLMIKGGAVEDDDIDDAKWEGIRSYWRFKADHFNNIMHHIQGDRTFSKWGGSVMDSLVGAFLTQNVSDFLSSSAFMSLRARFPAGNATESSTGAPGENKKPSDGPAHSPKLSNGFPKSIIPEQISFSNLDKVTQDICIDKSNIQLLIENLKHLQLAKALEPLLCRDSKSEIAAEPSTPSQSKVAVVEYVPDCLVSCNQHEVAEESLEAASNIGDEHAITFPATQAEIPVERSQPRTPYRPGIAKAAAKNITQSAEEQDINSSEIEIETALVGKSTSCLRPDYQAEITEQNGLEVSMDEFVPQRRSKALEELPYLITRSEIDTEGNSSSPTMISSLPEAMNDSTEEVGMKKTLEGLPYPATESEIATGDPISSTVTSSLQEAMDDSVEEVGMDTALEEFPSPVNQSDIDTEENPTNPTVISSSHDAMDDSAEEVGINTALEESPYHVTESDIDIDTDENLINPTVISSLHDAMDDSAEEVGINTALEEFSHPVTQSDIDTKENPIKPTMSSSLHEAIDDSAQEVRIKTALQELPYPVSQSEIDTEENPINPTVISSSHGAMDDSAEEVGMNMALEEVPYTLTQTEIDSDENPITRTLISILHEAMDDFAKEIGINTAIEELPYPMIQSEIATGEKPIPLSSLHEAIDNSPEKVGRNKAVYQFREQASGTLISSSTQIEIADADGIDATVPPGSQSEQDSVEWTATLSVTQSVMKTVEETIRTSGGPASFSDNSRSMDSILENRLAPEGASRMEVSFGITAEASNEIVPLQCLRETVQISAVVSPTERSQFDVQGKFNIVSKGKSDILTKEEQEQVLAATLRSILGKKTTSRTDAQDQVKPLDLQKLRHVSTKLARNSSRLANKVQYRLLSGSDRARWEQGLAVQSQRDKWEPLRSKILADEGYSRPSTTEDCIDWEAVRLADVAEVADVIKDRGMNNVLAGRIKSCLQRIHQDQCGSLDLEWIRKLPPDDAKDFLLSIRGLGLKSVECIRLLTLHHPSFPVDTNVGRIAVRLGWVPLEPLPEETQLHLLELYPIQAHIQQYLWPRLCKLDQQTLYELHYQMITFGKVFCTKSKPNCNACPMRSECKHFASAYASAKPLLTGPEERGPSTMLALPSTEPDPQSKEAPEFPSVELSTGASGGFCIPIIEEPSSPEETHLVDDIIPDIEDGPGLFHIDLGTKSLSEAHGSDSISYLNFKSRLTMDHKLGHVGLDTDPLLGAGVAMLDLEASPSHNFSVAQVMHSVEAMKIDSNTGVTIENVAEEPTSRVALPEFHSQELILLPPQAAYIPLPQLKNIQRLRTVHYVYELPDDHPLLAEMDKRLADDPCFYLLAIWSPDEVPESMPKINDEDATNPFASCCHGEGPETVKGTLLVPCRTAMRGCFPLNGTYFQVNEVFADYASSMQPIEVPRTLLWSLQRRFVYFGTAVTNLFRGFENYHSIMLQLMSLGTFLNVRISVFFFSHRPFEIQFLSALGITFIPRVGVCSTGMTQEEIQCCFKKGYVCVRAFDQKTRKPKLLAPRLHQSSANIKRPGPSVRRGRGPSVNKSVKVRVTKTTQSMSMVPS